MSGMILQINFKFHVPLADYEAAVSPLADSVAAVPGLQWKIWLVNEAEGEAGGVHCFTDADALRNYLNSDLVAGIVGHPALSDFSVKQFDIMTEESAITRAPITQSAMA